MAAFTYRNATAADAPLMSRIGPQAFSETFGHLYTPENLAAFLLNHSEASWLEELTDARHVVRIAELGGRAVGYAKVGPLSLPFATDRPAAELDQLYVLRPWQGTGVARALMDWAMDEARGRGAREMILSVFVDNHRARRFYARYGFAQVGTYAFMVGDHADEDLIMRAPL